MSTHLPRKLSEKESVRIICCVPACKAVSKGVRNSIAHLEVKDTKHNKFRQKNCNYKEVQLGKSIHCNEYSLKDKTGI